jgi:hypothetical protein
MFCPLDQSKLSGVAGIRKWSSRTLSRASIALQVGFCVREKLMLTRRLVVTYVLLVGLPLVLLLAILRAGNHLRAPLSVGGDWIVTADLTPIAGTRCKELLDNIKQPFINVSQSGSKLIFNLNDKAGTTILGALQGATLTMAQDGALSSTGGCADPEAIYLKAKVENQGPERIMTGVLGFRGCDACAPVSFRAVRKARAANGGE